MLDVLLIDSVAFRLSSLLTGKMSSRGRFTAKKNHFSQKNTLFNFDTTFASSIARAILNDVIDVIVGIANLSKKKKHVGDKLQEKKEKAWLSEYYWFIIEKDNICVIYYVYISMCFTITS